jgi:hypothetical protein
MTNYINYVLEFKKNSIVETCYKNNDFMINAIHDHLTPTLNYLFKIVQL